MPWMFLLMNYLPLFRAIRKIRYAQQHVILVSSSPLIRPGNGVTQRTEKPGTVALIGTGTKM